MQTIIDLLKKKGVSVTENYSYDGQLLIEYGNLFDEFNTKGYDELYNVQRVMNCDTVKAVLL